MVASRSSSEGAVVCVCGPCGSGKSTTASLLAKRLGARLVEGDNFHPEANKAKMAAGTPLDDADRMPWLAALRAECSGRAERGEIVVLACSALKRAYREALVGCATLYEQGKHNWVFALLDVPEEVLRQRLGARQGHFMPPALLASQLAAMEKDDPQMLHVPVVVEGRELVPDDVVRCLLAELQRLGRLPWPLVPSAPPGKGRRWLAPGLLGAWGLLIAARGLWLAYQR
mmetsp:Transcript_137294/g.342307  ORF Transcript_137294/g.342307 Transcript_137294/m.342307 type:complete len:229 (+) Transcript_137294:70-756(+)